MPRSCENHSNAAAAQTSPGQPSENHNNSSSIHVQDTTATSQVVWFVTNLRHRLFPDAASAAPPVESGLVIPPAILSKLAGQQDIILALRAQCLSGPAQKERVDLWLATIDERIADDSDLSAINWQHESFPHEFGLALLHTACSKGDTIMVRLLLHFGCVLNAPNYPETPLHSAATAGHVGAIRLLLEHCRKSGGNDEYQALLSSRDALEDATPLHFALNAGRVEASAFLIDSGSDLTLMDSRFNTPLHMACRRGLVPIVQMLLRRGCSVRTGNRSGDTPLQRAVDMGHFAIAELLLAKAKPTVGVVHSNIPCAYCSKTFSSALHLAIHHHCECASPPMEVFTATACEECGALYKHPMALAIAHLYYGVDTPPVSKRKPQSSTKKCKWCGSECDFSFDFEHRARFEDNHMQLIHFTITNLLDRATDAGREDWVPLKPRRGLSTVYRFARAYLAHRGFKDHAFEITANGSPITWVHVERVRARDSGCWHLELKVGAPVSLPTFSRLPSVVQDYIRVLKGAKEAAIRTQLDRFSHTHCTWFGQSEAAYFAAQPQCCLWFNSPTYSPADDIKASGVEASEAACCVWRATPDSSSGKTEHTCVCCGSKEHGLSRCETIATTQTELDRLGISQEKALHYPM